MKMNFKKTCIALALAGGFVSVANAAPVVISSGGTSATIADSGLFSSSTALGLSNGGLEYINLGTWASNYTLRDFSGIIATADQALGDSSNPFGGVTSLTVSNSAYTFGSFGGWDMQMLETITSPGHLVYAVTITNNTGHDVDGVRWGFGIDPDQGVPGGFGNGTTNVIDGVAALSSVTATSANGYWVTLKDITSANASLLHPYVDPASCCSPVDPLTMHLVNQGLGSYGFSDSSINMAFELGHSGVMKNGASSVLGYELVMGVPEPETYAMFMAGLGLMGFIARRRKSDQS